MARAAVLACLVASRTLGAAEIVEGLDTLSLAVPHVDGVRAPSSFLGQEWRSQIGSPPRRLKLHEVAAFKWWQWILIFFALLSLLGVTICVLVAFGCCCAEFFVCHECGWGKRTKKSTKKTTHDDDSGEESEDLLSDIDDDQQHHEHRSSHKHRDYAGSAHELGAVRPQSLERSPDEDRRDRRRHKKDKKEKKEKKDKRNRSVSPNRSIHMHGGSPYRPEVEETDVQGSAVYNMYADVYYRGQPPEKRSSGQLPAHGPIPLPAFGGASAPISQIQMASGSYAAASGHARSTGQASSSHGSFASGPRILETIVHEPVLESGSSLRPQSITHSLQLDGRGVAPSLAAPLMQSMGQSGSVRSLAQSAPKEAFPVRSAARTSGMVTPLPQFVGEERRMIGEMVYEPVVPQRLGEVLSPAGLQQLPSPMFQSQTSYASSYQSSYIAPKAVVL